MCILALPFLLVAIGCFLMMAAVVTTAIYCLVIIALQNLWHAAILVMRSCGKTLERICRKSWRLLSREKERLAAAEHAMQEIFLGQGQCKITRVDNQTLLLVDENDLKLARKYGRLVGRQYGVKIAVRSNGVIAPTFQEIDIDRL